MLSKIPVNNAAKRQRTKFKQLVAALLLPGNMSTIKVVEIDIKQVAAVETKTDEIIIAATLLWKCKHHPNMSIPTIFKTAGKMHKSNLALTILNFGFISAFLYFSSWRPLRYK
jgi:hypothetical protein